MGDDKHRSGAAPIDEVDLRHRVLASASRDLIAETDDQMKIVYLSDTCAEILGYAPEELLGTSIELLLHPDNVERLRAIYTAEMSGGKVALLDNFRIRHKDGLWRWCVGTAIRYQRADGRVYTVGTVRDVTHRRAAVRENARLQERIQRAQRLEGLGIMAGGIAHDFNNLLTPILGQAALALSELPSDSSVRVRIEQIQRTAVRAASLTNQMLTYAGQGPLQLEAVDMSGLVREMYELLEAGVSKKAEVQLDLDNDLPSIDADRTQISQVVMNLLTNASEALGERIGQIELRTGIEHGSEISPKHLVVGEPRAGRLYVFVAVNDGGSGMDAGTRARIFDPFFTTKFTGRGLGLAAVVGIVRQHDGCIELDSAPGRGTKFRVLLPAGQPHSARVLPVTPEAEPWRGEGTILVADDDEAVRELIGEALERSGLTTIEAANGAAAIAALREQPGRIRAAILDRTMPDLTGDEVRHAMRGVMPELPILLVSGYAAPTAESDAELGRYDAFLAKPFLPDALIAVLRDLLEASEREESEN